MHRIGCCRRQEAHRKRSFDAYRREVALVTTGSPASWPAFAPVVSIAAPEPVGYALSVALPNGVKLDLRGVGPEDLAPLLTSLAGLPCSASTPG